MIIAPYYNLTTGDLQVWVTSDLWDAVSGVAVLEWIDWSGARLSVATATHIDFEVGAINSTRILHTNVKDVLQDFDLTNIVLRMQVQAEGRLPSSDIKTTFRHENWFHASPLNTAQLQDPGLQLAYSYQTESFSVTATTGVAAWVWLDYPGGAVVSFESNAFWLAPGESRHIRYKVKSDQTNGSWVEGVTVQSMWDQTLS